MNPSAQPDDMSTLGRAPGWPPTGQRRRRGGLIAGVTLGAVALVGATIVTTWLVVRPAASPSNTPAAHAPALGTPTGLTPTTAAADVPSPTPPAVHHVGETVAWQNGLKVTAYSFASPVAKGAPKPDQAGYVWGAIDVQVCVPEDSTLSQQPWYLQYADNTTVEPSSTGYNQFPKPEYPFDDRTVVAGTCTRGWITFPVPDGKRPTAIAYSTGNEAPSEWTV